MAKQKKNNIPATGYRELILWFLKKRVRLRVTGDSMLPILESGEEILINPHAYKKSLPKINDIIVIHHPLHPELILVKRIIGIDQEGNYFLMGDNLKSSTDSRHWGTVNHSQIAGMVTNRFS